MNKKVMGTILGLLIVYLGVGLLEIAMRHQSNGAKRTQPIHRHTVAKQDRVTRDSKLTDADVVGVWVNHHNRSIHQKITFTADHRWTENQHHVTNIYSGTWRRVGHHEISLAPYGETIWLYGSNFNSMNVLNYRHILTKETN